MSPFDIKIPTDASPSKRANVESLQGQWARETQAVFDRKTCQQKGGWGKTKQIDLEESEALPSFLCGGVRVVPVDAFYLYLIRVALASPEKRRPAGRFRKRPRARTENELRGLAIANRRRHEAALKRRAAADARRKEAPAPA